MKLHLPLVLRSSLLAAVCCVSSVAMAATPSDWGNTVYIGDSISHGFKAQPYRWFLFKNLVDIGVLQTEVGVQTGYWSGASPVPTDEGSYRGVTFDNLHAAQSGITANQVSGSGYTDSSRLGGTGIEDWLTEGGSYTMHSAAEADTLAVPDTAFIMLGTNDIFGAAGSQGAGSLTSDTLAQHTANMKQYLGTIVAELQKANPDVNIVINSIPTWSEDRTGTNSSADSYAALASLNAALKEWAEEQDGVTFVNINTGMIDVANTTKPGAAAAELCADTQHPNAQGNLIMAGNVAQQLGYAGRTAGLSRRAAADFSLQSANIMESATLNGVTAGTGNSLTLEDVDDPNLSYVWGEADTSQGFTVDFSFASGLGNGETDGWDTTNNFSLSLGNGTYSGTLNINEAYILWGDTLLYSTDSSQLTEDLRISYVVGDESQNISSGFYVWKGDMLIGEALTPTSGSNGLTLTNNTGSALTLDHLSLTTGSYAPTTTGLEYTTVILTDATVGSGTANAIRNKETSATGDLAIRVEGNSSLSGNYLVASHGDYTGSVDVILDGTLTNNNQNVEYNVVQFNGTLDGDISFTVAEEFTTSGSQTTWKPFLGAQNATVTGDISMTFSAENMTVEAEGNTRPFSLAGADGSSNINGHSRITVNAGTFSSNIYGGFYNASSNNNKIDGGTEVVLYGGTVQGNVYGGSGSGQGKSGGTINGGSAVTVGGGATVNGTLITAGGTSGNINGGTTLTVKHVTSDSAFYTSFLNDSTNTLSGNSGATLEEGSTRELRFDGVTLDSLAATVENFDAVTVTGSSQLSLTTANLGGATALTVNEGSKLTLSESTTLDSVTLGLSSANLQQAGANLILTNGALTTGTLTLNIDNTLAAAGTVTLWMYQGDLNATNVEVNAHLTGTQTMSYELRGSEDGYSYLEYKISANSTLTDVVLGNNDNALANQGKNDAGVTSGNLTIKVDGGTFTIANNKWLVASQGAYTGDIDIELGGSINKTVGGDYNVVHFGGALDGSISFTVASDFTFTEDSTAKYWNSIIGVQKDSSATSVSGDVSMTFSSADMVVNQQNNTRAYSLAGAEGVTTIGGHVCITVNAGTFNSAIYGGNYSGNGTIGKGTEVIIDGAAKVNGTIISAGGKTGTITGGTTLTVKNVTSESNFYTTFLNDSANTLSGNDGATLEEGSTRELRFDGVTLDSLEATVENFDAVTVTGGSQLTLTTANLGGATALTVDAGSSLTMNESLSMTTTTLGLSTTNTETTGANLIFTNGGLTTNTLTLNLDSTLSSNAAATGSLLVNQGSLNAGWVNIKLAEDSNAGYLLFSGISQENGSSYVNYKKFDTVVEFDGSTSFGNGNGAAIADLAISSTGKESGDIAVTTNGGTLSTAYIVANNNNWTGDIVVELGGDLTRTANGGYNVAQFQGTLHGSMTQIITEDFQVVDANGNKVENAGTFIGANNSTIKEDLTMVFSSETLKASSSYSNCVIAGSASGNVEGATTIIVNAGEFTGTVYGGSASNHNNWAKKGTNVTLNGGTIKGNVYGFGINGKIEENGSSVTVTGNATVTSATEGGSVTISAGGTGGTIAGGTTLTVKDATDTSNFVQNFNGTLSGNNGSAVTGDRTLCFDNTQVSNLNASLENFDVVRLTNKSEVTLENLGLDNEAAVRGTLIMEEGSSLKLTGGSLSLEETVLSLGAGSVEQDNVVLDVASTLNLGALTINLSEELLSAWLVSPATPMALTLDESNTAGDPLAAQEMTLWLGKGELSADSVSITLADSYKDFTPQVSDLIYDNGYSYVTISMAPSNAIPEPTTATLSLLALAALAARRRRK